MNLFDLEAENFLRTRAPLAERMRPATLDEFFGQSAVVGKNTRLYKAIVADRLFSMVFYGAPGTGKTTLAKIIAGATKGCFEKINAASAGVADIKKAAEAAMGRLASGRRTVLFIDEIHAFNKTQQDALLPYAENGTLIIIGATAQNPFFELSGALLSRFWLYEFLPLSNDEMLRVINNALSDEARGFGTLKPVVTNEAKDFLVSRAAGDCRAALNALELAVLSAEPDKNGVLRVTEGDVACGEKKFFYDKKGDVHYNVISAFIKSMRGSDPDAAVFYLAKMVVSGEDPRFIARRIMICASEDVGMADSNALAVACAASHSCERIGYPECALNLAHAAIYVAKAPKSNAVAVALSEATGDAKTSSAPVPPHLRDAKAVGANAAAYKYPHNYPGHRVKQQYLPNELKNKTYFRPGD